MPKGYKHLTYEKRCQIEAFKSIGLSQRAIARELQVHHSTLSRELSRNGGRDGYLCRYAQLTAKQRQRVAHAQPSVMIPETVLLIEACLQEKWSPEQIAGRLKKTFGISVSHETIYQHVYRDRRQGGTLYHHLRHRGKKYNRRSKGTAGRRHIPNRVDISERPAVVEGKTRCGDWEGDLIIGPKHKGAILTYVERKSKFTFMMKLDNKQAQGVVDKTVERFQTIKRIAKTITYDNGAEFASHRAIAKALDVNVYFATPYHSWERGLNEHTNGLIRQYFTKATHLLFISDEQIKAVENALNDRPRKVLNYKTPREVLMKSLKPDERVALAA